MLFRSVQSRVGLDETTRRIKGVADEADFARMLRRERDRADRTCDRFTLVAVDLGQGQLQSSQWRRRLARTLRSRLRSTDEAGWLSEARLGIVLPHTPEDGAWMLVESLRAKLEAKAPAPPLRFAVYSYSGEDGTGAGHRSITPHEQALVASCPDVGRAQSLEPLFFQPPGRIKRSIDILLAGLGLIVATPIMAIAGLLIRCTSTGPVLFRQVRAGFGGRPFVLYKLRTMVEGAEGLKGALSELNEQDGPVFKMTDDPRVTKIGHFLRKTSIDELPQLWNVLMGEMSIVGPRPPTLDEIEHYATWQRRRLYLTGGLTCFWQVGGRSNLGFLDWVRLDLRYLRRRSLGMDLLLILKTIPAVLGGKGAK